MDKNDSTCLFLFLSFMSIVFINGNIQEARIGKDGGFIGVVVAYHTTVLIDPEFVEIHRITENLFKEASRILRIYTNQLLYFKSVTFNVGNPELNPRPHKHSNLYDIADVRIIKDGPEQKYGYIIHGNKCGQKGKYIYISTEYLKWLNKMTLIVADSNKFDGARFLVSLWIKFFFGVFDEIGIPAHPIYRVSYPYNSFVKPTVCTKGVTGRFGDKDVDPCKIIRELWLDRECAFHITPKSRYMSLLASPFIGTRYYMCTDKTHNFDAPTPQNVICHYKSVEAVMSKNPEYLKLITPSKQKRSIESNDTSESPIETEQDNLLRVKRPSRPTIIKYVPTQVRERVILFYEYRSDSAALANSLLLSLYMIMQDLYWNKHFVELYLCDDGYQEVIPYTDISQAKQYADKIIDYKYTKYSEDTDYDKCIVNAFNNKIKNVEPGTQVILYGAYGTVNSYILTKLKEALIKYKVIFNIMSTDSSTKQEMIDMTRFTRGTYYHFNRGNYKSTVDHVYFAYASAISKQKSGNLYMMYNKNQVVVRSKPELRSFNVEMGFERLTVVCACKDFTGCKIKLTKPGKVDVDMKKNPIDPKKKILVIHVKNPKNGKYVVTLDCAEANQPAIHTFAYAFHRTKEFHYLKGWVEDNYVYFPEHVVVLHARLTLVRPVLNADMVAYILHPLKSVAKIILRDDGVGADIMKEDGVYSAYYVGHNMPGSYEIQFMAEGTEYLNIQNLDLTIPYGKLQNMDPVKKYSIHSFDRIPNDYDPSDEGAKGKSFSRVDMCGFKVYVRGQYSRKMKADYDPNPGSIKDLRIISHEKDEINLMWTSPGDDYFDKQLGSVLISISDDVTKLQGPAIDKAIAFKMNAVLGGSLIPPPPYAIQRISLKLPYSLTKKVGYTSLHIAVRGHDKAGFTSPEYNIVSFVYYREVPPGERADEEDEPEFKFVTELPYCDKAPNVGGCISNLLLMLFFKFMF